ncbi:AAA family ATPase [Streptomyces sp. N2-109]|uniref:AAA family ATPase n=1 Tax=Streptomyces gossypii TaxID=2883101 RepID=A0ABT2JWP5_9ACTN|nr:AAA domain-containing protein [Streptomyces gossypii]MCT2592151.1 AAA family ATPase [Streptomyces gossypii]
MTHAIPPGAQADAAVAQVLHDLDHTDQRGIVVNSPPGAGKSTLVVRAAGHLAAQDRPVMIIAQTNEQVDDLTDRLAETHPQLRIGRLHKAGFTLPDRVARHENVVGGDKIGPLRELPVVVGTAAKWAHVKTDPWDWAIVDEAYQMRSDAILRTAPLCEHALFVGDPGQLDPFATVETDRWAGLTWNPLLNAVDVSLAHNPGMPTRQLPVSWRLPASAAPLVQRAFYPFYPFTSGTREGDRLLTLGTAALGATPADGTLAQAAATGWGYLELPARHTLRTDPELAAALAATADRLLQRGALANGNKVDPERIAIGTAHNDQAAAVRRALRAHGPHLDGITVDTANKLQGREFDVTLVWHPLSGRADASAFHLETGRLCVLLSRHRHACVVVARAGIRDLLDRHPSTRPVHLDVPPKFPDGWRAHQLVLDHLDRPEHRTQSAQTTRTTHLTHPSRKGSLRP